METIQESTEQVAEVKSEVLRAWRAFVRANRRLVEAMQSMQDFGLGEETLERELVRDDLDWVREELGL